MEGTASIVVNTNIWAVISFIFYLLIIIGIGIFAAKFSSSGIGEYFLAGRKLKQFVVALSAVVSGRSAWLLLGMTGMAYIRGASAVWAVVGYIIVELFLFLFLAKRLRRFTERLDNITLPDFFESRFNDQSGLLRVLSVSIILIFMIAYIAAQFNGGGKAFYSGFGLDYTTGLILTAAIVFVYTVLGGFLAVSLTDMIQAFFMIITLVLLPIIAIFNKGGMNIVISSLQALDPNLIDPFSLTVGGIVGYLGIGLGSPGNPHILVRYMSIDKPRQLRLSALIGTTWNVLMAWGALYIGLVGRSFYPKLTMLPGADQENLFPFLAYEVLQSNIFGSILFGMIIASIFAAIMSTADSQLLVAASGVVRDIYQKLIKKGQEVPQQRLVLYSRIVVFLLVIFSLILATTASQIIFWLVLFAWAGLGASIGPAIILSLFWKRTTKWGVVAGLISGTLATIIWNQTPALKGIIYELVPAFFISAVITIVVSLFTKPPENAERYLDLIAAKYRK